MSNQNNNKGRQLERAVQMIQENILEADQRLKGTKFLIEPRKIIEKNGVHHEIDIWVQTQPGTIYESCWFFECKHWDAPVGKNQILILNAKVELLGATKGFLVAPAFTKDALAQAFVLQRIKLVECSTEFSNKLSVEPFGVAHEFVQKALKLTPTGKQSMSWNSWEEVMEAKCLLHGEAINFGDFIHQIVSDMIREDNSKNQSQHLHQYNYYRRIGRTIPFRYAELLINGIEIVFVEVYLEFFVNFYKLRLTSKFEVNEMGRTCSFEYDDPSYPDEKYELDLVLKI